MSSRMAGSIQWIASRTRWCLSGSGQYQIGSWWKMRLRSVRTSLKRLTRFTRVRCRRGMCGNACLIIAGHSTCS
jgi:hypothetical protein